MGVIASFEDAGFASIQRDDTTEIEARAQWPVDRHRLDTQFRLNVFKNFQSLFAWAVHLVDESDDGNTPQTTDVEQFFSLSLYAIGEVQHHHRTISRDQRAIGVLAEVLVSGSIEQIDGYAFVLKGEAGGTDRNTALPFQLHPV